MTPKVHFVDKNGVTYISSPDTQDLGLDLLLMGLFTLLLPFLFSLTLLNSGV